MEQSFNARSDFNKRTIVGDDYDFSFDSSTFDEILCHGIPWMWRQLLRSKRNSLLVVVKVEDYDIELLIQFNQLLWVVDTAPRHVGDVNKSIDASEIDEYAVRSDVLDCSFQYLSFLKSANDDAFLLFELGFNQGLVGYNYVFKFLVDFDNFEIHLFSNVNVEVTDWLHVNL